MRWPNVLVPWACRAQTDDILDIPRLPVNVKHTILALWFLRHGPDGALADAVEFFYHPHEAPSARARYLFLELLNQGAWPTSGALEVAARLGDVHLVELLLRLPEGQAVSRSAVHAASLAVWPPADVNAGSGTQMSSSRTAVDPTWTVASLSRALHQAASEGDTHVMEVLLKETRVLTYEACEGAVCVAARFGEVNALRLLLNALSLELDEGSMAALAKETWEAFVDDPSDHLSSSTVREIVQVLLQHTAPVTHEVLSAAARHGWLEAVRVLLAKGADPSEESGACLCEAARSGNVELVELLLQAINGRLPAPKFRKAVAVAAAAAAEARHEASEAEEEEAESAAAMDAAGLAARFAQVADLLAVWSKYL